MIRYITVTFLAMIISSHAFAFNVDDPAFWKDWKREGAIEHQIMENINQERISAKELVDKANNGYAEHAFYLGVLYYLGYRSHASVMFERDHKKALSYFSKAQSQGYLQPYIHYYMGMILWNGEDGAPVNKPEAKAHLKSSATPESFLVLAAISYKNPSEQLYWYTQLAHTDDWRAILTVAHWYSIGRGTSPNNGEAHYWYERACKKEIEFACTQLKSIKI